MRLLTVGEDLRQRFLSQLLQRKHEVFAFGTEPCPDRVDGIVLPCPSFDRAGYLRAACTLQEIAPFLQADVTVFCCGKAEPLTAFPIRCVDLLADETAVLQNARLTAEAALSAVMAHTADSLHGKRCLIVGYGRIGTYLTRLLAAVGADCTVLARREESRTLAEGFGYRVTAPETAALQEYDLVFNTAPAQVLSEKALAALPPTCLWVELASAPGGLPQGAMPFSVLPAGGLPGRVLPKAAAQVLYDAIEHHLV